MVHRLAQARALSRAPGPGRATRRRVGIQHHEPHPSLRAGVWLQRQRHRFDAERQDARDRPIEHRAALHGERDGRNAGDHARGGESVPNGDGILLDGKTLYVVQNRLNVIAKIALSPDLRSGRVLRRISSPDFDVPTTVAELGSRLYAVNARFGRTPTPTTEYSVVQVAKWDWVELIAGGRVNRAPATCRPAGCRCERRDQAVGDSLPGSQRRAQVGGRRGTRPVRP